MDPRRGSPRRGRVRPPPPMMPSAVSPSARPPSPLSSARMRVSASGKLTAAPPTAYKPGSLCLQTERADWHGTNGTVGSSTTPVSASSVSVSLASVLRHLVYAARPLLEGQGASLGSRASQVYRGLSDALTAASATCVEAEFLSEYCSRRKVKVMALLFQQPPELALACVLADVAAFHEETCPVARRRPAASVASSSSSPTSSLTAASEPASPFARRSALRSPSMVADAAGGGDGSRFSSAPVPADYTLPARRVLSPSTSVMNSSMLSASSNMAASMLGVSPDSVKVVPWSSVSSGNGSGLSSPFGSRFTGLGGARGTDHAAAAAGEQTGNSDDSAVSAGHNDDDNDDHDDDDYDDDHGEEVGKENAANVYRHDPSERAALHARVSTTTTAAPRVSMAYSTGPPTPGSIATTEPRTPSPPLPRHSMAAEASPPSPPSSSEPALASSHADLDDFATPRSLGSGCDASDVILSPPPSRIAAAAAALVASKRAAAASSEESPPSVATSHVQDSPAHPALASIVHACESPAPPALTSHLLPSLTTGRALGPSRRPPSRQPLVSTSPKALDEPLDASAPAGGGAAEEDIMGAVDAAAAERAKAEDAAVASWINHRAYKRHFTAIRMGAPRPQVELAMRVEGLDPGVLDHPDAQATPLPSTRAASSISEPAPKRRTLRHHPKYAPWFVKLRMGVSRSQCERGMRMAHLDPSVLDRPDDPYDSLDPMP